MSTEAQITEILGGGEVSARKFDPKSAAPFVNKSVSEATRHAYGRALREFFQSVIYRRQGRKDIRPDVTVVKRARRTGRLTRGVVKDVLTNSSFHPHGIKVRLKSREVGMVRAIIPL